MKKLQYQVSVLATISLIYITIRLLIRPTRSPLPTSTSASAFASITNQERRAFWSAFNQDLLDTRPDCPAIPKPTAADDHGWPRSDMPLAERPDLLKVTDQQELNLRQKHAEFQQRLANRKYELPYIPETKGIVMTADYDQLLISLTSIRMIRSTGCELPVEVFISEPAAADLRICDLIYPTLGATCIFMSDIIGYETFEWHKRYEYKILAMIFSSFEEFIALDVDIFPIDNPEGFLTSEPFLSHGLLLNADYWQPSESRHFFTIIGQKQPALLNATSTSESSVVMSRKNTHTNFLLMAAYYNLNGPAYYYKLMTQGAYGEGDKETFGWAARVTGSTYYQVRQMPTMLGYNGIDGNFRGEGIGQYDARVHYALKVANDTSLKNLAHAPFWIHARSPKLVPLEVFRSDNKREKASYDADDTAHRIFADNLESFKATFHTDVDVEQIMWEGMSDMICEYNMVFTRRLCRLSKEYVSELFYGGRPVDV